MKKAQIQDAQALCINCREGITHPICPDCLAREMESWHPEMKTILLTPDMDTDSYVGDGVRCLFCGKAMSICAHCYSMDVYDSLIEGQPALAEEFIERFDYGLKENLL
jgi:hypothetical protein